ncbi:MAG: hypothetical protein K6T34_00720 [Thermoflavifilum sp.]|nr:hypothetical protein [Thermoflavifilum sp.]
MKKWLFIGICLLVVGSVLLSQHLFCKNHQFAFHRSQPAKKSISDPTKDSLQIFSPHSPLLIWGRYDSFKTFKFSGNYWESILSRNNTLWMRGITTYQNGNVIYIVPEQFTLSTSPSPTLSPEKSGATLRSNK